MYNLTGEEKYLEPIEKSLSWVKTVKKDGGWMGYYDYQTGEEIPEPKPNYGFRGEWIDVEEIEKRLQGIRETGEDPLKISTQQFPSKEKLAEILVGEKGLIEEVLEKQLEEGVWLKWKRKGEWVSYRGENNQIVAPFFSPGDLLFRYLRCEYAYQGKIRQQELFFRPRFAREKYEIPEWYHDFHRRSWPIKDWFNLAAVEKRVFVQKKVFYSFPNPFTLGCGSSIKDTLSGKLKIRIYNILGQLVRELKCSRFSWDGRDSQGLRVPPGVYFYEGVGQRVKQILVLR
jgi:hypothetical protein